MPRRPTLLIETPDTARGYRYLTLPDSDLGDGRAKELFSKFLTGIGPADGLGWVGFAMETTQNKVGQGRRDAPTRALLLDVKDLASDERERVVASLGEILGSLEQIIQEIPADELKSQLLIRSPALARRYDPWWAELASAEARWVTPADGPAVAVPAPPIVPPRTAARRPQLVVAVFLGAAIGAAAFFGLSHERPAPRPQPRPEPAHVPTKGGPKVAASERPPAASTPQPNNKTADNPPTALVPATLKAPEPPKPAAPASPLEIAQKQEESAYRPLEVAWQGALDQWGRLKSPRSPQKPDVEDLRLLAEEYVNACKDLRGRCPSYAPPAARGRRVDELLKVLNGVEKVTLDVVLWAKEDSPPWALIEAVKMTTALLGVRKLVLFDGGRRPNGDSPLWGLPRTLPKISLIGKPLASLNFEVIPVVPRRPHLQLSKESSDPFTLSASYDPRSREWRADNSSKLAVSATIKDGPVELPSPPERDAPLEPSRTDRIPHHPFQETPR